MGGEIGAERLFLVFRSVFSSFLWLQVARELQGTSDPRLQPKQGKVQRAPLTAWRRKTVKKEWRGSDLDAAGSWSKGAHL